MSNSSESNSSDSSLLSEQDDENSSDYSLDDSYDEEVAYVHEHENEL